MMSNFSLRLPYLIYLSIGSMLFGVLVAPAFRDIPQENVAGFAAMSDMTIPHPTRNVAQDMAPSLTMTVSKDSMDGWNLTLATERFRFAPDSAGEPHEPNTGHAHLYVDDVKIARLYGPFFHIPDLAPGQYEITVSLSGNDHAYYAVDGQRVEARAMITQGELPISDG